MDYVKELKDILKEDFNVLANEGDTVSLKEGDVIKTVCVEELGTGRWFKHNQVITQLPDGRHFAWQWEQSLTRSEDNEGPAMYGAPRLKEVVPVEETIIVTRWVHDELKYSQPTLF